MSLSGREAVHLQVSVFALRGDAVARTAGDADVGVLGETVKKGGCELVVAEDAVPLAEGEVGSDDGGRSFVARGEHIEEEFAAGLFEWNEAKFVEEQKRSPTKPVLQAGERSGVTCFDEGTDQIGSSEEEDVVPVFDGFDAERDGDVGLAGADGTDEDDVARGGNPSAAG